MKEARIEAEEALVSFDITTNVPMDEAVDVIHRKLTETEDEEDLVERAPLSAKKITELFQLCLKSTCFSCNGEQRQSAAMGSPVVSNLYMYMEFFEELALKSAPSKPRFWKRHVDDTCCIMMRNAVEPLLNHLDVNPTIKFTAPFPSLTPS
jgi:hypothetical protein